MSNEQRIVRYVVKRLKDPACKEWKFCTEMELFLKALDVLPSYAIADFVVAFLGEDGQETEEEPADA